MKTDAAPILRWMAMIAFVVSASLKLAQLVTDSQLHATFDPVVGLMTLRETTLAAIGVEFLVAWWLLRIDDLRVLGCLVIWFCVIATLYQLGLALQGGKLCPCLGVATAALGERNSSLLTRGALLLLWVVGVYLLWRGAGHRVATEICSSAKPVLLALLASATTAHSAEAVRAQFQFEAVYLTGDKQKVERARLTAVFDECGLVTSMVTASGGPYRPAVGPCTNTQFLSRNQFLGMIDCAGTDETVVGLKRAEAAWEFANCGDTFSTCAFLMIRCLELFPGTSGPGIRRVAPPWTTLGQPFGLVTLGHYSILKSEAPIQVTCEIRIDAALLEGWRSSPWLGAGLERDDELVARAERQMRTYNPGFLSGRLTFTDFTNVLGLEFPTIGRFEAFRPATNQPAENLASGAPSTIMSMIVESIAPIHQTQAVSVLPLERPRLSVSDQRLHDRSLGVWHGRFSTNRLASFEVSPLAKAEFEKRMLAARGRRRSERLQRVFFVVLTALVVTAPALLAYRHRKAPLGHG